MARNLYRFYLYTVCIALLIFATFGLGRLLQLLLSFTDLRGAFSLPPTNADVVQVLVFFGVSWFISAALGGFHYWLLRRDMQSDPLAGGSAIRSFFLNMVELIAAPLAIGLLSFGLQSLGQTSGGDQTFTAAIALATLALVAVLEWERRRSQAAQGVAMVFQRLHMYGVQLILLLLLISNWISTVRLLIDDLLFAGQGGLAVGGPPACGGFTACAGPNLLSYVAATLWITLCWIGYGVLARNDSPSLLRQVLHYGSLAIGVGIGLYGIERAVELLLRALFGIPASLSDVVGFGASYDFVSLISLGLLIVGVYSLWLRMVGREQPEGSATMFLIEEAIAAALFAVVFWWGIGYIVLNVLESIAGQSVRLIEWASSVALAITGASYILLDLYLLRSSTRMPQIASAPRRGFVFALLGGSILDGAVGATIALYAWGTFLLGSPFNDWPHVARIGVAAFIVGAVVAGLYLWRAMQEHLFHGLVKRPAPAPATLAGTAVLTVPTPAAVPTVRPSTIEGVLDELLVGKITRDEAAGQLRELMSLHPLSL
ncbi:MAG TPA: hypothetical protein VNG51_15440 [Ktedonobacteraceae bacterium]|nr:hypothetical protein [Ktedonobacteraceae bacterium]